MWDSNQIPAYFVYGYDKGADIYETICSGPSLENILGVAAGALYYHTYLGKLCRTETQEPFDWFVVCDRNGNTLKVFTPEVPEGYEP